MVKTKLKGKAARPSGSAKRDERARRKELQKERRAARHKHSSAEEEEFARQIAALGCRVETVQADGNCLFRSLADQLGGDERAHRRVRDELVAYMRERRDWFELFVEDDEPFLDYVERMGAEREWGGNQELYAATQLYRCHVVVHVLGRRRGYL